MRFFVGCFASAVLGALFVLHVSDRDGAGEVVAQERNISPAFRPSTLPATKPPGPSFEEPASERPLFEAGASPFDRHGLSPEEAINVAVYDRINKGVVHITTRSTRLDGFLLLEQSSEGTGSGAVLDHEGHILTNLHVVDGADQVTVTMYDGKSFEGMVIGADPVNDIAVLRIDARRESLHPIALGNSSQLDVGMRVFAIGNPFGLERTMTTGIISSLNRSLKLRGDRTIKQIIQIDAAINPGNSGGPLVDSHARLIGMNTAIASKTGQSSGVGFAIPVNLVRRVVPQLIRHGHVIRPEIGIQQVYETERGLLIATLTPDGPAAQAGLKGPRIERHRRGPFVLEHVDRSAADLIVRVDDRPVQNTDDFLGYIESKQPGERVVLTVIRNDQRMKIPVVLGGDRREPTRRRR